MKTFLYILAAIVFSILLFMGGCRVLSKQIFNKQSCESFNIDNIELRTGIDIPKVKKSTCNCSDGKKNSTFELDLTEEEFKSYVSKNKFFKTDSTLIKENETEHTKWMAILDPDDKSLTFNIEYLK